MVRQAHHERVFIICHAGVLIYQGEASWVEGITTIAPVVVDTFVLSFPTPQILQSPLVTSRMTFPDCHSEPDEGHEYGMTKKIVVARSPSTLSF
jgi:hypothetical protein